MNTDITLRDVVTREFVAVSESDSVGDTAALLADEGVERAVVVRGEEPVGSVDASAVIEGVLDGADTRPVRTLMGDPPPALGADESLSAAVAAFAEGARRAVVHDGGTLVGVVDPRDLLTAGALRPTQESDDPERNAADTQPRTQTGTASPRDDRATAVVEQSICEGCGTFARDLAAVNGQRLCSDCREV